MTKLNSVLLVSALMIFIVNLSFSQGKSSEGHINLGASINSAYDEQNLAISTNGNTLYFTIAKHPENAGGKKDKGDIWYSTRDAEGNWGKKKRLGAPLNNKYKNAVLAVLNDGNTLLLRGHYSEDGSAPKTQGISVSNKNSAGEWSFPEELPVNYFMNKSEDLSLSISSDGKVMILSMESFGTFGAEDLYVSFKKDGKWSDPRNLGSEVNTHMQELSPFLAADGKSLYFSSNGRKGFGSKDIYVTTRKDDTWLNWTKPVNLGENINSGGAETFFIHPYGVDEAFLVSTQNSDGYGDINKVNLKDQDEPWKEPDFVPQEVITASAPQEEEKKEEEVQAKEPAKEVFKVQEEQKEEVVKTIHVSGKVYNSKTSDPVEASIILLFDNQEVFKTKCENTTGVYILSLPKAKGKYIIKIASKGYYEVEEKIEITRDTESFEKDFQIIPLEVGTTIQLENVLFERGTANLLDESYPELERVINMLKDNPNMEIELGGHTDNSGSFKLNLELSQKRVEEVKKILVERGIEETRIIGKGYGGTRPIASNKNEESRKLNRRVEFTILKID